MPGSPNAVLPKSRTASSAKRTAELLGQVDWPTQPRLQVVSQRIRVNDRLFTFGACPGHRLESLFVAAAETL